MKLPYTKGAVEGYEIFKDDEGALHKRLYRFYKGCSNEVTTIDEKKEAAVKALKAALRRTPKDVQLQSAEEAVNGLLRPTLLLLHAPNISTHLPAALDGVANSARLCKLTDVAMYASELRKLNEACDTVVVNVSPFASYEYVFSAATAQAHERMKHSGSAHGMRHFTMAEHTGAAPRFQPRYAAAATIDASSGIPAAEYEPCEPSPLAQYHLEHIVRAVLDASNQGCRQAKVLLLNLPSYGTHHPAGCDKMLAKRLWLALCGTDCWAEVAHLMPTILGESKIQELKQTDLNPFLSFATTPLLGAASPTHLACLDGGAAIGAAVSASEDMLAYLTDQSTFATYTAVQFHGVVKPSALELRFRLSHMFKLAAVLSHNSLVEPTQHRIEEAARIHRLCNKISDEQQQHFGRVLHAINQTYDQVVANRLESRVAVAAAAAGSASQPSQQAQQAGSEAAPTAATGTTEAALAEPTPADDAATAPAAEGSPTSTASSTVKVVAAMPPMAQDSAVDEAPADQAAMVRSRSVSGEAGMAAAEAEAPPGFNTFTNRLYGYGGTITPAAPNGHKRMEQVALDKEQQAAN